MAHIGQEAGLGGVGGFGLALGAAQGFLAFLDGGEVGQEDDRAAFAGGAAGHAQPAAVGQFQFGMAGGVDVLAGSGSAPAGSGSAPARVEARARHQLIGDGGKEAAQGGIGQHDACRPAPPASRLRGWSPARPPAGFRRSGAVRFPASCARGYWSCITVMELSSAPVSSAPPAGMGVCNSPLAMRSATVAAARRGRTMRLRRNRVMPAASSSASRVDARCWHI